MRRKSLSIIIIFLTVFIFLPLFTSSYPGGQLIKSLIVRKVQSSLPEHTFSINDLRTNLWTAWTFSKMKISNKKTDTKSPLLSIDGGHLYYSPYSLLRGRYASLWMNDIYLGKLNIKSLYSIIRYKKQELAFEDIVINLQDGKIAGGAGIGCILKKPSYWINLKVNDFGIQNFKDMINDPDFYATGSLQGSISIKGGKDIEDIDVLLSSTSGGGKIISPYLFRALSRIPQSNLTDTLTTTTEKNTIVFNKVEFSVSTKESGYLLHILLDGQHILEFNINISKSALQDLIKIFKKGG